MRYYLDTNILIFVLNKDMKDNLSSDVLQILMDYANLFYTSTVCVQELIHLIQIGKTSIRIDYQDEAVETFPHWLQDLGIEIVPINIRHLQRMASLPIHGDHRDPNDRLIIAQAIEDRIPLISSDRKFERYQRDGLEFVYNER